MIWGKTAKACGTAEGMDNGVPIVWVGGSAQESLSTRRILKKMMLLLLQTHRFLHLQATLLKAGRSQGFHNHVRDPRGKKRGSAPRRSLRKGIRYRNILHHIIRITQENTLSICIRIYIRCTSVNSFNGFLMYHWRVR
jgi:hypothetical protein